MRPSATSARGVLISIGSSATNTRPSGALHATVGCLIFGALATTSIDQSDGQTGRSAAEQTSVAPIQQLVAADVRRLQFRRSLGHLIDLMARLVNAFSLDVNNQSLL